MDRKRNHHSLLGNRLSHATHFYHVGFCVCLVMLMAFCACVSTKLRYTIRSTKYSAGVYVSYGGATVSNVAHVEIADLSTKQENRRIVTVDHCDSLILRFLTDSVLQISGMWGFPGPLLSMTVVANLGEVYEEPRQLEVGSVSWLATDTALVARDTVQGVAFGVYNSISWKNSMYLIVKQPVDTSFDVHATQFFGVSHLNLGSSDNDTVLLKVQWSDGISQTAFRVDPPLEKRLSVPKWYNSPENRDWHLVVVERPPL